MSTNTNNDSRNLSALSDELANAVELAGASTVTVNARRRLPASGIVWSPKGLIVTANHVVERDEDITVTTPAGDTVDATLLGRDKSSDVALLSIGSVDLPPAGKSASDSRPGHLVLAIGRPRHHGLSASLGVVSLVGGPWRTSEGSSIDQFIRSDAAMLPGFSGGPLADVSGATIGMNSSSVGRRGGLTIPFGTLNTIVTSLQSHGKVRQGYLGIGAQSIALNNRLAASLDIDQDRALVVVGLETDGPAEVGGMLLGDVIVSLHGNPISTVEEIQNQLTGDAVGKPADLKIIRGGSLMDLSVGVGERL